MKEVRTERQPEFRRNAKLEETLGMLSRGLAGCEEAFTNGAEPPLPIVFVIGAPRSGTTILMQWLAQSGHFGYPSNLLSRFFSAPFIGALVQEIIHNPQCDYRGELADMACDPISFHSTVGKTTGALSPNEFWYWWRRFIPNEEPRVLSPDEEAAIDTVGFRRSLAAIQTVWQKPFVTKGIIMQYNLRKLREIFPRALFLHTRRDPFFNVQSLLLTREKYFGDRTRWFSVKPPGYKRLLKLSPEEQVAGQVRLTVESISREFATLPEANCLEVEHENFCRDPKMVFQQIQSKLHLLGADQAPEYEGPAEFAVHDEVRLSDEDVAKVRAAIGEY